LRYQHDYADESVINPNQTELSMCLWMERLSIKPIPSLSQGSKTNPATKVTYFHGAKGWRITRSTIFDPN